MFKKKLKKSIKNKIRSTCEQLMTRLIEIKNMNDTGTINFFKCSIRYNYYLFYLNKREYINCKYIIALNQSLNF